MKKGNCEFLDDLGGSRPTVAFCFECDWTMNSSAGSLLGAFRLCAASQHFPPSLPFFGFVLCFLVYKGGFFSSNRVARLSSAYDFGCVVTSCDLLLNESCVFLAFIIRLLTPSIPAGFRGEPRTAVRGRPRPRARADTRRYGAGAS